MTKTPASAPPPATDRAERVEREDRADREARAAERLQQFLDALTHSVHDGSFVRLVLSRPLERVTSWRQLQARPLRLRGQDCLSLLERHATRDETHNLPVEAALEALRGHVRERFGHAHLMTRTQDVQLLSSARGQRTLRSSAATHAPADAQRHDRDKHRWVAQDRPFLQALGVTDDQGRVIPAMARKWKQINKFVEVFAHAFERSPLKDATTVRVIDFGAGKGYLTFALHDHLRERLGQGARVVAGPPQDDSTPPGGGPSAARTWGHLQVIGVELRPDMVALCNDVVARLGLEGLRFEQGDITARAPEPVDVVIALHACDTATDHAIHLGIRAGASIILTAPCCHKQLRPQLLSPHPLRPILQHGIHLGQEAEMLTDGLRALLLEARGYDTQVFEFVSLEHTAKNKMILAVRRAQPRDAAPVLAQIREIKAFYGIREQALETLLDAPA